MDPTSLLGLLQEEYPDAHQLKKWIRLIGHRNRGKNSIFMGKIRSSKGQHAKN